MKPETNLLRKVFINGDPERLPKEDGWYSVHSKDANANDYPNSLWMGNLYIEGWLRDYDYYFVPVPREEIIEVLKNYTMHVGDTVAIFNEDNEFEQIADSLMKGGK